MRDRKSILISLSIFALIVLVLAILTFGSQPREPAFCGDPSPAERVNCREETYNDQEY